MKYNELLHQTPGQNHVLAGLKLSNSRKDFSNKIKYNDYYFLYIYYYRRKRGGEKGSIYIKGGRTTLECLASLKNNRLHPSTFDRRTSTTFPFCPGS